MAVSGDFNWRIGNMYGRRTQDVLSGDSGGAALARRWHQQTGLRPLYGRKDQPSGVCTSRAENGMAEVDGISICTQVPEGWKAQAVEVPEWECYSDRGGVHRLVGAVFSTPPSEARPQQGAQAGVQGRRGVGLRLLQLNAPPLSPMAACSTRYGRESCGLRH